MEDVHRVVTYKRYDGGVCNEKSGLDVRTKCSLPSLLTHFQPAGTTKTRYILTLISPLVQVTYNAKSMIAESINIGSSSNNCKSRN